MILYKEELRYLLKSVIEIEGHIELFTEVRSNSSVFCREGVALS
jgi:hypothetical protein